MSVNKWCAGCVSSGSECCLCATARSARDAIARAGMEMEVLQSEAREARTEAMRWQSRVEEERKVYESTANDLATVVKERCAALAALREVKAELEAERAKTASFLAEVSSETAQAAVARADAAESRVAHLVHALDESKSIAESRVAEAQKEIAQLREERGEASVHFLGRVVREAREAALREAAKACETYYDNVVPVKTEWQYGARSAASRLRETILGLIESEPDVSASRLSEARGLLTFALAAIDAERQSPRWLDDLRARIEAYLGRSS